VHWSSWAEKVEYELLELKKTCRKIFMVGLSMGGGNSLYVAAEHQDKVDGIVLVNPMIHIPGLQIKFVSIISKIQKSRASVGDDIKKPGVTEWGYDALPIKGVAQLYKYLKLARKRLPRIKTPVLLFHSVDDHTLDVSNTEITLDELGSINKQRIELLNSYHVATLDYDADIIFENTRLFIEERSK
jgi:carboxylesterase